MRNFTTPQEKFWAGEFGDEYTDRNDGPQWIASNLSLFSRILSRTQGIRSVTELGANRGLNLLALRQLLPQAAISAVEINAKAVEKLRELPWLTVEHSSILDFKPAVPSDLVFIKGVLIHLNPDVLPAVYDLMHAASSRYVCLAEYYSPSPVGIPYRGHADRLFKRDFAGEMLRAHPDLKLIDYGFVYRGDPNFPQDDITWFLMEKTSR
ncbi:MAG TPA: pseudaminic acid biosynthesis-associated methylase [Opitutaceae bacterium]|nr:pseudaminic acid biosynthesis-associated methylase [Opitutaceae bacterium]